MSKHLFRTLLVAVLLAAATADARDPAPPVDLSKDRVLYVAGYAHLDTQWRWSYPLVIGRYIPNTMWNNFPLFDKYPHYVFNFTGARRYQMMKEYYPAGFEAVRASAAKGRWFPSGSSWEENDVLVPSSESLLRQLLYGHRFFKNEFGVESAECMLPDSFGYPASLPSILAHCGLRGFSTQKLYWGSAVGIPFNLGRWEGPDGESVIAALNAGKYDRGVTGNLSFSTNWIERLDANGARSGVFADFMFYGVGDRGGAPTDESVDWVEQSATSRGPVRVISDRADRLFRDLTAAQKARLPGYQGDLLLTEHSAGSLTSQSYMKRWNRMNETLAEAAEKASVTAHLLGAAPYPREKIRRAWGLVLGSQMHDILTGTCLPKGYEYSWNDEIIAMNCFATVLEDAVGGVARALDTRVDGVPLVVFNPLSVDREDVVEAEVDLPPGAQGAVVYGANGLRFPTQVLSRNGTRHRLIFLARAPSIGFVVYSVKVEGPATADRPSLAVSERSLENVRYRVSLNDAGDIASVFDKTANRELLASPARLAFLTENPAEYPAWNMDWNDRKHPPRGYVSGPAKFRVVENGPVRVAIEVERESENSIFIQTLRLAAGAAGDRIEVANRVDWQTKASSLKAEFPLTVSNPLATYNWGPAKIQRGNNDPKKYEVPSHQWFDLTDKDGAYGVAVLTDTKYGSDKPADNTVRLTLLYSPGTREDANYFEQRHQDWGRHEFVYALSGHPGDWRSGKADWEATRLGQPLRAFRTTRHPGPLGHDFSLLQLSSDQVAVRTIKLAEDSDRVIVRLEELNGAPVDNVELKTAAGLAAAVEVNGLEQSGKPLTPDGTVLVLNFKPYQIRSLACAFRPPAKLKPPVSWPVKLPYNIDVFSFNESKHDGACDDDGATVPAEMIDDTVMSEGIAFRIGPRKNGKLNAVACQGQKIALPKGDFNRLYLLAMAVNGNTNGIFTVDDRPTSLNIQDWSGYVGSWDNRVFRGLVEERTYCVRNPLDGIAPGFIKRDPIAWFCSHRHQRNGSDAIYSYAYFFKYRLDLPAGGKTLTLPVNPRIRVLAVTAASNENDATEPAAPLYDDFTGRPPIVLRSTP